MTKMISCLIVDDEASARETLVALLDKYCPEVKVLGEAESVASAKEALKRIDPDIVFLDIHMPGENGFQLLEQVENTDFLVVFTTAYDQYALKAIKMSAADYLLKPVDFIELQAAVNTVKKRKDNRDIPSVLEVLSENLRKTEILEGKIILSSIEGFSVVKVGDILYLEGDRNYTRFVLRGDKKMMISKTLKHYEEILPAEYFMRIHKSYLVNIMEVVRYTKGSASVVEMSTGTEIDISRSKKDEFVSRMQELYRES